MDERLQWLPNEKFMLFLYSMSYNADVAFNYFKNIVEKRQLSSILTIVLSIKLFGKNSFELLKKKNINCDYFGGIDNLYRLIIM
ncbi:hypothetical protein RBH29_17295 [Herbivorax sp. ANBcel31]|uniref:hypothetical protein n=1 Tax=Herbivorax sp. ANBcel31 TaxID=3069754 RepID=UPI0027B0C5C4|nr:hypothetical protein [Herbivorax sp. ANBcel31]MDQ2088181.1 hypothetical protein [Herbivorax sp. ANBcel31]